MEEMADDLVSVTVSGTADGVMRFLERIAELGRIDVVPPDPRFTDTAEEEGKTE